MEEQLKNAKVAPSKEWRERVLHRLSLLDKKNVTEIESESKRKVDSNLNLFFNLFTMNKRKLALFATTSGLIMLTVAGVGGGLVWKSKQPKKQTLETIALSEAEKIEILNGVTQNNPTNAVKGTTPAAESGTKMAANSGAADQTTVSRIADDPYVQQFNYSSDKMVTKYGPAGDKCKMYNPEGLKGTVVYEYESYYNNGKSYYKGKNSDEKGVYSYYLNTAEGNKLVAYEYKGGDYALKTLYNLDNNTIAAVEESMPEAIAPDTTVAPEPTTAEDKLKEYFGEGTDVVGKVTENGKDYYVIESKFKTDCNQEMMAMSYGAPQDILVYDESKLPDTIINRTWVDVSDSYKVAKTLTYLQNTNDSSLIAESNNNFTGKNVDFSEVANNFKFDLNKTVKEFDMSETTGEKGLIESTTAAGEELKQQNIKLLLDTNSNSKVNSLISTEYYKKIGTNEFAKAYADRKFYRNDTVGENMYKLNQPMNSYVEIDSISYASIDTSKNVDQQWEYGYMVNIYKGKSFSDIDTLATNYFGSNDESKMVKKDIEITIDGVKVAAKEYTITSTYETMDENGKRKTESSTAKTIFIEYSGALYNINMGSDKYSLTSLTSVDPATTEGKAKIDQIVKDAIELGKAGIGG